MRIRCKSSAENPVFPPKRVCDASAPLPSRDLVRLSLLERRLSTACNADCGGKKALAALPRARSCITRRFVSARQRQREHTSPAYLSDGKSWLSVGYPTLLEIASAVPGHPQTVE